MTAFIPFSVTHVTVYFFFFSSRRRHTRFDCDWSSDVCSSNLLIDQITDATNFARALESDGCDLVITDYQLRWSDGLAVLRVVKNPWPDCTVIIFTRTGSEESAVEAFKAGRDDYGLKTSKHY